MSEEEKKALEFIESMPEDARKAFAKALSKESEALQLVNKNIPPNKEGVYKLKVWQVRGDEKETYYAFSRNTAQMLADEHDSEVDFRGIEDVHVCNVNGNIVTRFIGQNIHGKKVEENTIGTF